MFIEKQSGSIQKGLFEAREVQGPQRKVALNVYKLYSGERQRGVVGS